jgi:glutamate racemase
MVGIKGGGPDSGPKLANRGCVNKHSPIAVLDSGLGGLTVVRSLRSVLPGEDVVYFGDTARLPYGSKTAEVVTTFVSQIIRYLLPLEPKQVVIACNTATALALPEVRAAFPALSIVGVIEPGAEAAIAAAGDLAHPLIGVIATEATIASGAYQRAIARRHPGALVVPQAAPLLVPIIEDGRGEGDSLAQLAVSQYIQPMIDDAVDVLVLGCTHYPILRGLIERTINAGPRKVPVVDSANHCALEVARRLEAAGLCRDVELVAGAGRLGRLSCWVTDDSPKFARLATAFLGVDVDKPTWISPDELPTAVAALEMRYVG